MIGVVMTGSNSDGSEGIRLIKARGGVTMIQHPSSADTEDMPLLALQMGKPDYLLEVEEIAIRLIELTRDSE